MSVDDILYSPLSEPSCYICGSTPASHKDGSMFLLCESCKANLDESMADFLGEGA